MSTPPPRQDAASESDALAPDALLTFNMFMVRHMIRVYHAFDGDLLEAIVLGEVAHHNVSPYLAALNEARRAGAASMPRPDLAAYLPTNAFSIAQATGIPRQTVRRKVKRLVARGWLRENKAGLVVSPAPSKHFREFNREVAADVLATLNTMLQLTHSAAGQPKQSARVRR